MAMDAILATVADGVRAIVDIDREASRNKLISCLIYYFILNPKGVALANPFCRGSQGWCMFRHKNHAAGEANDSTMAGMFVCCLNCSPKAF
jgi:hypothetical protein